MTTEENTKVELPAERLTPSQIELIKQLELWADDLPIFYKDNLNIIDAEDIIAKPNICAHLVRELDSGLRSIFGNMKSYKGYCGCNINGNKEPSDNDPNICKHCNKEFRPTNKQQIAQMLGKSETDELVVKWHKLSSDFFHKFAHRDSEKNQIRDFKEFLSIWNEYEKLLQQTFGKHLDSAKQIDILLKNTTPTEPVLKAMTKILTNDALNHYFFSNLKQIDWLKLLNENNLFDPKDNPKPKLAEDGKGYYILSWSIFRYLEWASQNLPDDDNYIKELVSIIDKIIQYKEDGERINNFRTDFSVYKILTNIPSKYIKDNHIAFIKDSLEKNFHSGMIGAELSRGFISKLIKEDNKDVLLKIIDVICSYVKTKTDIEPLVEEYWFVEFVKNHKEKISKYAPKEISQLLIDKLNELKKLDIHSFSHVWIPTIEQNEEKDFPERYESQIIDLLTETLKSLQDGDAISITKDFMKSDFDIFKRLGFYLIGKKYELLKDVFFDLDFNPLEIYEAKHELYDLLKQNSTKFSDEQINIIINWIEEQKYVLDHVKDDEKEIVRARYKKEWYLALLDSNNRLVQEAYNKYDKINDVKISHPGFISWRTTWSGESTPMDEHQINESTIDELIERINSFKEEGEFRKTTIRGFADEIQKDVERNPKKYSDSLDKFKDINLSYISAIIRGFINIQTKNINDKKIVVGLDWNNILSFINELINDNFWELAQTGEFNYKEWVVAEIARLLESGTKQDDTGFDLELLPIAKEILIKLTKHEFFYKINSEDYVSFSLNSTEGKILDAMLNYSLRYYRNVDKVFDKNIKEHFEKRINENKYLEVYTILGQYLPQFHTLDKVWIDSIFDKIFPINNEDILKASISGLFFNTVVYSNFYKLLKEKGIYKKLLDSWSLNKKSLNESLLRHICLGYLESWEEINDNTLIQELLNKEEALDEMARFLWIISKNIKPEYKIRIKKIWQIIADNNKDKPILGKLLELLAIFDTLDDDLFKLCMDGAKYVEGHHVHYITEYLLKYLENNSEYVGRILLEIIKNAHMISDYKKEDVIKIVEQLYHQQKKQLADEICNQYFEKHDLLFLREVYAINNSSTEGGYHDD